MRWLHEITSFAVSANGDSLMDCIANWMKVGHMMSHDTLYYIMFISYIPLKP